MQFPNDIFQLNSLYQNYVVLNRAHLKEALDASEEDISAYKASVDALEAKYTFRPNVFTNNYHALVVREQFNRHMTEILPDMVDEIGAAFEDEFKIDDGHSLTS